MGLRRGRTRQKEPTETTPAAEQESPKTEEPVAAASEEQEKMPFDGDKAQAAEEEAAAEAAREEAKAKAALAGKKPRQEVANTAVATEVIPASTKPQNQVMAGLAEDGYEGLELGFGSFPILKLENEGIFADTEENEYGKEFDCIIYPTRSKYVIKNTRVESKKDEEAFYSYDRIHTTDGTPIEEIIQEWAEEGWGYEIKHYLEAPAQIVGGEYDEEMVMLSIPPASKNKLSGYFYKNRLRGCGSAENYVTKCLVGKKVTSTDHDFYPWKFKFVDMLED